MAKTKATKVASKKHLARLERERRQTLAITYTAIVLIVAVVGLIVYGILSQTVLLQRQPIVKLGDQVANTHEFQVRARIRRQGLIRQYFQYVQYAQMFGISDPTTDPTFATQLNNITGELDNSLQLGQNVVDEITDNLLIRQYAAAHGITVSKEEVKQAAYNAFGYYPDGTETPTAVPTEIVYPTLSLTQIALVPPTATRTPLPTPTYFPTDTPTVTPTLAATFTPTSVPSITPSPTPYTLQGYQDQYNSVFPTYQKLGMSEADFNRIFFEDSLYQKKVYEAITADVLPVQEEVWARHILVADETTAKTVITLLKSGYDFSALAASYSLDPGSKDIGGDLGWFKKGDMVAEFETAAFSLPIGVISDPVQSSNGWHVIQVLGHENRALTADELNNAKNKKYQDWLGTAKANATTSSELTIFDYWMDRVPTDPTIESVQADGATAQAKTQAALPTSTKEPATPKP